jgi:hypothetical protein
MKDAWLDGYQEAHASGLCLVNPHHYRHADAWVKGYEQARHEMRQALEEADRICERARLFERESVPAFPRKSKCSGPYGVRS